MVGRHAEAQVLGGREAAVGRQHADAGRLEGVLLGEADLAVVHTTRKVRVTGPFKCIVPLQAQTQ